MRGKTHVRFTRLHNDSGRGMRKKGCNGDVMRSAVRMIAKGAWICITGCGIDVLVLMMAQVLYWALLMGAKACRDGQH